MGGVKFPLGPPFSMVEVIQITYEYHKLKSFIKIKDIVVLYPLYVWNLIYQLFFGINSDIIQTVIIYNQVSKL